MGASIWLVVIVPFMAFYGIFGSMLEYVFGTPTEKVVLPYNPDSGMVWEYDNADDPYIFLSDTKIEGNEQVFYFKCVPDNFENPVDWLRDVYIKDTGGDSYAGDKMELVFTDKNGNQEIFYATAYGTMEPPQIYRADECLTFDYECIAQNPKENGVWTVTLDSGYVLAKPHTYNNNATFTVVVFPDNTKDGETFGVEFEYFVVGKRETCSAFFEIVNGEITVKKETHEIIEKTIVTDILSALL